MPHPDYRYTASVTAACSGPGPGTVRSGPGGTRRSRDGARLAHAEADALYWHETYSGGSRVGHHRVLVEPSRAEILTALTTASEAVEEFVGEDDWNGGQVNFAFSGHGSVEGGLVTADAHVTGRDLVDAILADSPFTRGNRRISLVLDCCHAGRVLAEIMAYDRAGELLLIDGFAASMHDELAWELDDLGHGALTFSLKHQGNQHVDPTRLARAIRANDQSYVRLALQAFTPNPVTYLTEGEQTSIDVMNGHHLQVAGGGYVEVFGNISVGPLLHAMEDARQSDVGVEVST